MKERRGVHRARRGSGRMGLDIMGRGGSHLAGDFGGEKEAAIPKQKARVSRQRELEV